LNGLANVVRFAWAFSGRFADLDGELFAERAESRLQLVEPRSVPEIEQAIYLGQVAVELPGEFRFADSCIPHCGIKPSLASVNAGRVTKGPFLAARGSGISRRMSM
jgi:hypothetical protein